VRTVRARFADGSSFEATRESAASPYTSASLPEGRAFDPGSVDRLVSTLSSLRFTDTTETTDDNAVAARAHARTYELVLDNGNTWTFAIGRRPAGPAPELPPAAEGQPAPPPQPGPVFVHVRHPEPGHRLNALMDLRAFQVGEWLIQQFPENTSGFAVPLPPPAGTTPGEPVSAATPPLGLDGVTPSP
jgi:hypothetical protein